MAAVRQRAGQESSHGLLTPMPGGRCRGDLRFLAAWRPSSKRTRQALHHLLTQPQKADGMTFAVVTAPFRFKGRDHRCHLRPSPMEEMSMSHYKESTWHGRSRRELSSLPQFPALSEVSSGGSHLLPSALPLAPVGLGVCTSYTREEQRLWSK